MIAKNYMELPTEGLTRGCMLDEGNAVTVYLDAHEEERQVPDGNPEEGRVKYETVRVGHTVGWDGLKEHTEHVAKLLVISDSAEETAERIQLLQGAFGGRVQAVRSNPTYAEIVLPGVSKASGLQKLAAKLGIPIENVMAIGDSNNDLPMLEAAGHSVAMGNALPEVKAACDDSVGTCEEHGFAEAIERFVLHDN